MRNKTHPRRAQTCTDVHRRAQQHLMDRLLSLSPHLSWLPECGCNLACCLKSLPPCLLPHGRKMLSDCEPKEALPSLSSSCQVFRCSNEKHKSRGGSCTSGTQVGQELHLYPTHVPLEDHVWANAPSLPLYLKLANYSIYTCTYYTSIYHILYYI